METVARSWMPVTHRHASEPAQSASTYLRRHSDVTVLRARTVDCVKALTRALIDLVVTVERVSSSINLTLRRPTTALLPGQRSFLLLMVLICNTVYCYPRYRVRLSEISSNFVEAFLRSLGNKQRDKRQTDRSENVTF